VKALSVATVAARRTFQAVEGLDRQRGLRKGVIF
jgi:hypothetical protein